MTDRLVVAALGVTVVVVGASLVPLPEGGPATFPDGVFHAVGYAAVAAAVAATHPRTRHGLVAAVVAAVVVATAIGGGVELLQALVPGRTPSVGDAAANTVGAVAGAVLLAARRRIGRRDAVDGREE